MIFYNCATIAVAIIITSVTIAIAVAIIITVASSSRKPIAICSQDLVLAPSRVVLLTLIGLERRSAITMASSSKVDVCELVRRFAQASHSLTRDEQRTTDKLCEVAKGGVQAVGKAIGRVC